MKKYLLFGMLTAILAGALVLAGCEGAATPNVTNYYKGGPNNGLEDGDTLFLQNKPTLSYSTVASLGALQLELLAPSLNDGVAVENIVYTGTDETLDYNIVIPDGMTLFIGYRTTNSPSEVLGKLTIGKNGSLTVGNAVAANAGPAGAFLYVANGADPVTGSAVTLKEGGRIVATFHAGNGVGEVRGAPGVQIIGTAAAQRVIVSDTWSHVDNSAATGGKVYYIGTEKIGLTSADYATVITTTEDVTAAGGGSVTVGALTAKSVKVSGGTTLTGVVLVSDVTLDTTDPATNGLLTGYDVTGNVEIVKAAIGTLNDVGVSGNVTAWGQLVTATAPVVVGGYVAIDNGATIGIGAILGVQGNVYICSGTVDTTAGVGLADGLATLGTIYVNGGGIDFHDDFGGTPTADIVLKAAAGASEETGGYARVAGTIIGPSAAVGTPRAVITTSVNNGGIIVGAQSTIGSGIWLEAGSYTASSLANDDTVTFTGGAAANVSLNYVGGSNATLTVSETGEIKAGGSAASPVTIFGAGSYTTTGTEDSSLDNKGVIAIGTTLTGTGKITTILKDGDNTATTAYGLTAVGGSATLAKVRGTRTVVVNNTDKINTAEWISGDDTENVGPLGTITGITLVLPKGVTLAVDTLATLGTGGKIEIGSPAVYTFSGTGTIVHGGASTTAELDPTTGITITSTSTSTPATLTGASTIILETADLIVKQPVLTTAGVASVSVGIKAGTGGTVVTTSASGTVKAGGTFTLGHTDASSYTFKKGATAPTHSGGGTATKVNLNTATADTAVVNEGATFEVTTGTFTLGANGLTQLASGGIFATKGAAKAVGGTVLQIGGTSDTTITGLGNGAYITVAALKAGVGAANSVIGDGFRLGSTTGGPSLTDHTGGTDTATLIPTVGLVTIDGTTLTVDGSSADTVLTVGATGSFNIGSGTITLKDGGGNTATFAATTNGRLDGIKVLVEGGSGGITVTVDGATGGPTVTGTGFINGADVTGSTVNTPAAVAGAARALSIVTGTADITITKDTVLKFTKA